MSPALLTQLPQAALSVSKVLLHAQPVGWFAIGLIVLYAAYTMIRVVNLYRSFGKEQLALNVLASRMSALEPEADSSDDFGFVLLRDHSPGTLAHRMVSSVLAIKRLALPDLSAIRNQIKALYLPDLVSLRSAPNTLLLIGLFGTVAGLGTTIASLAPQLGDALFASNPQALTSGLADTLREMQTAFAATLWGILAAVATSFVVRGIIRRHHVVTSYAAKLLSEHVAPLLMPSSTEAQLDDIRRVLQNSKEHMVGVSSIMQEAAVNFGTVLDNTGKGMTESIDQLASVSQTMRSALEKLSEDVKESASSLRSSTDDMRSSTEQLSGFHSDMRNAYTQMNGLFHDAQKDADRRSQEQLEKVESMQDQFGRSSNDVIHSLSALQRDLSESSQQFERIQQLYINSTNQVLLKVGSGFEALDEQLSTLLESHRREMSETSQGLRSIHKDFRELAERMNPALLPREEWSQIVSRLNEIIPALEGSRERLTETIVKIPEQMASRLASIYEQLGEFQEQSDQRREEAATRAHAVLQDIGKDVRQMHAGLRDVRVDIGNLATAAAQFESVNLTPDSFTSEGQRMP